MTNGPAFWVEGGEELPLLVYNVPVLKGHLWGILRKASSALSRLWACSIRSALATRFLNHGEMGWPGLWEQRMARTRRRWPVLSDVFVDRVLGSSSQLRAQRGVEVG